MPLNPDCHICHGDPEHTMICSACHWDIDTAFHQISHLQAQVRYLQAKTGYKYVAPKIGETGGVGTFPDGAFPNLQLVDDIERKTFTLEEAVGLIDGRSLQRIFREVEDSVLVCVLWSLPTKELVDKMKKNMSKNHFARIVDDIKCGYGRSNSADSVAKFLRVISQLEEMGEIVVAREDDGEQYVTLLDPEWTAEEIAQHKAERDKRWDVYREQQRKSNEAREAKTKEWLDKMGIK